MASPDETINEPAQTSWKAVVVPTEGMPRLVRAFYRSAPGKLLYLVTSDVRLLMRVSMLLAVALGVLHMLFDLGAFVGVPASAAWASLFFDLLILLVAVSVLYALRVIVDGLFERS